MKQKVWQVKVSSTPSQATFLSQLNIRSDIASLRYIYLWCCNMKSPVALFKINHTNPCVLQFENFFLFSLKPFSTPCTLYYYYYICYSYRGSMKTLLIPEGKLLCSQTKYTTVVCNDWTSNSAIQHKNLVFSRWGNSWTWPASLSWPHMGPAGLAYYMIYSNLVYLFYLTELTC